MAITGPCQGSDGSSILLFCSILVFDIVLPLGPYEVNRIQYGVTDVERHIYGSTAVEVKRASTGRRCLNRLRSKSVDKCEVHISIN